MYIHVVQTGDTIWSIAQAYGASPQRIVSDNGLTHPPVVGQALIILIPETVYTVQPGDTLYSIASQFGVTWIELLQNNPSLAEDLLLIPGQTIAIRFQSQKRRTVTLNGYAYPHVQRQVLSRALPFMTYLTIFGYGFQADGELIPINDEPLIALARQFLAAPVMLLSSVTEHGNFSGTRASMLFNDQALQSTVLDNVLETMGHKGYLGLDIDFEFIEPEDEAAYLAFLENASARLHAEGYFMNVDLAPKTSAGQRGLLYEAHNYANIGAVADRVLIMTYEWGYAQGPPMAVAPINQVRRVAEYAVSEIPPGKILMGLPNYGYDWPLPFVRGYTVAISIGNQYAVELAGNSGTQIQFDETAQSPFFTYYSTASGQEHVVWFEDVRSMQAKFDLMDEFRLSGGGYWNLMRPFAQNWAFVSDQYTVRKVL